MKKLVVYSAIFGGYDSPKEHYRIPDADYVMFSDHSFSSKLWDVRNVPCLPKLGAQRTNRFYKLNPHIFFPEYEYSLYIDGNWQMLKNLFDLMIAYMGKAIICNPHDAGSYKKDLYAEADLCIKLNKAPLSLIQAQIAHYKKAGIPKNFGLWGCQFMLRRHNTDDCKKLMETWWAEVKQWTARDQISYPFAVYLTGVCPAPLPTKTVPGIIMKHLHAGVKR
jgi:hypothetical protein